MEELVTGLTIFVLAVFVGFEIITKVPSTLHTSLMSGSNAISGITLIGALLAAGSSHSSLSGALTLIAIAFATITWWEDFLEPTAYCGCSKRRMGLTVISLANLIAAVLFMPERIDPFPKRRERKPVGFCRDAPGGLGDLNPSMVRYDLIPIGLALAVIKRSFSPGFAGIPNPLFAAPHTLMLFGDAQRGCWS